MRITLHQNQSRNNYNINRNVKRRNVQMRFYPVIRDFLAYFFAKCQILYRFIFSLAFFWQSHRIYIIFAWIGNPNRGVFSQSVDFYIVLYFRWPFFGKVPEFISIL